MKGREAQVAEPVKHAESRLTLDLLPPLRDSRKKSFTLPPARLKPLVGSMLTWKGMNPEPGVAWEI